jgi:cysteine desulfurase / selenocysteine lyase
MGGGDMIKRVSLRSFAPNELPHKFEAGTPAIAEAVGMGAAVDYLSRLGMEAIAEHEHHVTAYAMDRLEEVPGVWLFGPSLLSTKAGWFLLPSKVFTRTMFPRSG